MLATVLALSQVPSLVCPITGKAVNDDSPVAAVAGLQFRFANTASCESFLKDPKANLAKAESKGWTVGLSFFDPVARRTAILSRDGKARSADMPMIKGFSAYRGIAIPFTSIANKATFDQDPKAYMAEPTKFSLICPYMSLPVASIERALGYKDIDGVRYFLCCDTCVSRSRGRNQPTGMSAAKANVQDWPVLFAK